MRPKKLAVRPQGSVPLMEKAYCPIRLAFEKFPTGGGGGGSVEPLPPQAASKAAARSAKQKIKRFTEHRAAEISGLLRVAPALRVVCGCARFSGLLRLWPHLLGAGNNREKKRANKKDTARSHENDWFHIPFPPARVPLGTLVRCGAKGKNRFEAQGKRFIALDGESPRGGF